jgi:hypothetical protein
LKLLVCDFRHTLTKVSTQPGCLWMATTIVVPRLSDFDVRVQNNVDKQYGM